MSARKIGMLIGGLIAGGWALYDHLTYTVAPTTLQARHVLFALSYCAPFVALGIAAGWVVVALGDRMTRPSDPRDM
jgi:hypothetical protein